MDCIVSVIIPVYNTEKYLDKCIRSVLMQSYKKLQIILVNDGSDDKSLKICRRYEKKDSRILVADQKNGGAGNARNEGISRAEGEYIAFIDSDDWIEEDYILQLLRAVGRNKNCIPVCGYSVWHASKCEKYIPSFHSINGRKQMADVFQELMDGRYMLMPVAKLYKTSIIKRNNLKFDEDRSIGEDLLFNLAYTEHVKGLAGVQASGYHYRIRKGISLTQRFGRERLKNTEELFTAGQSYCVRNGLNQCICHFSKYYFKSHMIFLESRIGNGENSRLIKSYIKEIMSQNAFETALQHDNRKDIELCFYELVFRSGKPAVIQLACCFRIFVKKMLRGF